MTDRDLTPEEARAEVEAFLGSEWTVIAPAPDGSEDAGEECYVSAWRGPVAAHYFAPTFRAAVSALKAAWRDAVRPWVFRSVNEAKDNVAYGGGCIREWEEVVARVLEEGSNGCAEREV